jgi:uncharacterized repeat protein (TIGR03943 family)
VRRGDGGPLLVLAGAVAVWASVSGAVLQYLRPGMRTWVGLAGAVLVGLGVAVTVLGRRERIGGHGSSRVGWLVAVPICVAVTLGPGSLGSYAAGRTATFRDLPQGPSSFDLEQYLVANSFGGQAVRLSLFDFVSAAEDPDDAALLDGREVRLTGFVVTPTDPDPGAFYLTRFLISCCAADAVALQVEVRGDPDGRTPAEDSWVEVVATLEGLDDDRPIVRLASLSRIDEPRDPYEFPVSRGR